MNHAGIVALRRTVARRAYVDGNEREPSAKGLREGQKASTLAIISCFFRLAFSLGTGSGMLRSPTHTFAKSHLACLDLYTTSASIKNPLSLRLRRSVLSRASPRSSVCRLCVLNHRLVSGARGKRCIQVSCWKVVVGATHLYHLFSWRRVCEGGSVYYRSWPYTHWGRAGWSP